MMRCLGVKITQITNNATQETELKNSMVFHWNEERIYGE